MVNQIKMYIYCSGLTLLAEDIGLFIYEVVHYYKEWRKPFELVCLESENSCRQASSV